MKVTRSYRYFITFFLGLVLSTSFSQSNDSVFRNQLYFKLKSYDVLTFSSWKIIEKNPNNIPSSIFPFKNFLDSIGIVTIKQPFGKRIDFEKLYITFLVEFTENNHELKKLLKASIGFQKLITQNLSSKILKTTYRMILAIVVAGI